MVSTVSFGGTSYSYPWTHVADDAAEDHIFRSPAQENLNSNKTLSGRLLLSAQFDLIAGSLVS